MLLSDLPKSAWVGQRVLHFSPQVNFGKGYGAGTVTGYYFEKSLGGTTWVQVEYDNEPLGVRSSDVGADWLKVMGR